MKGFEEVKLGWKGEWFVVPPERQLMLIAEIEDALSGASGRQALDVLLRKEGPPYSRLAAAYGAALRYAGADVSDQEVYLSIMEDISSGDANQAIAVQSAVMALMSIIAPPLGKRFREAMQPEKPEPEEADTDSSEPSTT